ncbi:MAG: hypothetical protein H5T92_08700, partial [Synergistales bacterium]|nr:hypothetical protein [Synergistales bacterium]
MFNSRRGSSVIVGAILLISVAVASAAVLWSAFSMSALPQSNVNQVLEDVRIVKVTPDNGRLSIYVINRGSTLAVVDSLYFESPYGSLNWTDPITPVVILPGEIAVINSSLGVGLTEPVLVRVVTNEGAQSSVLVMNDSGAATGVNPGLFSTTYVMMPYMVSYNENDYDLSSDDSLQELDLKSIPISTQENMSSSDMRTIEPLPRECVNVTRRGGSNLWQYNDTVTRKDNEPLYMRMVYNGTTLVNANLLILKMEVQITPKPNRMEIKFYNWTSGQYITSGDNGYLFVNVPVTNQIEIVMFVPRPAPDIINPLNGSYKFAVDTEHPPKDKNNNDDSSTVNFKSINVVTNST